MDASYLNLLYLLWTEQNDPEKWPGLLAEWGDVSQREAARIIDEQDVDAQLLETVAGQVPFTVEDLRYTTLPSKEEVLHENIRYLLSKLEHGGAKELASAIGVAQETVSNWKKGKQLPTQKHRDAIGDYFGVAESLDLESDPLFLQQEALTDQMRRNELRQMIESAEKDTVEKHYESVKKLLEG